jgi:hypothetical protein
MASMVRFLEPADRERATRSYEALAEQGLRTLAVACRTLGAGDGPAENAEAAERELTLLGIVGILDPPRPEVPDAVARARNAGIKVRVITGDAVATARHTRVVHTQAGSGHGPQAARGAAMGNLTRGAVIGRTNPPFGDWTDIRVRHSATLFTTGTLPAMRDRVALSYHRLE